MLTHDDHRYALVMQRVLRATDLGDHREVILAAAEAYGVRHVRVFGSVARGEASGSSDRALTATNSCRHGSCTISRSSARPPAGVG
jgi:hypothetical protein